MKKIIFAFLFCFFFYQSFCQTHLLSTYLQAEFNGTTQDVTKSNNPAGIGGGVQSFFNVSRIFKPTLELTADAYLGGEKVLRVNSNGEPIDVVSGMFNLFGGVSFHPIKYVYLAFTAGPSRVTGSDNSNLHLGIKPSFGWLSKNRRWTARVSYINIFKRENFLKENFTSISFSIGKRL